MYRSGSAATATLRLPSLWHRSTDARISAYMSMNGLFVSAVSAGVRASCY
jgi:hypothetical protein